MGDNTHKSSSAQQRVPRLVVGLGASAGGIRALQDFVANVPASSEAAYVVILHLAPEYESHLAQILQASASLPVTQVTETVTIAAHHVYVIPPNRSLTIESGRLVLLEVARIEDRHAPVDIFFRALAEAQDGWAVCVVLSGTGSDGTMGLKAVKEAGGLVIAQSPDTAEYGDMPRHAIATGLVDYVLPVADMPRTIAEYERRLWTDERDGGRADLLTREADATREILTLLRQRTGNDFSNYKTPTVGRRIERRMSIRGLTTVPEYAQLIREDPDEAQALLKELLISVTHFFRDSAAFTALERAVIPKIFEGKSRQDQVRAWVAGCATGEEAYSIGILLVEAATGFDAPSIQVFASDLDDRAIATAREGWYAATEMLEMSERRLRRFFQVDGSGYRVKRELRELVLFAHHNVIKDPPFSHLDLIACRNLLIYLNRFVQDRVLEMFHFALRPGGYLFLGTSEAPDGAGDLFAAIEPSSHLYESRTVTTRLSFPLADARFTGPALTTLPPGSAPPQTGRVAPSDLHLRLLEQYAPPSIVVTDEHTIVHVSESAGQYLQVSAGEPSRDLMKLARPEVKVDLRTALFQAAQQKSNVEIQGVRFPTPQGDRILTLKVRPMLHDRGFAHDFFLVMFEDVGAAPPRDRELSFRSGAQVAGNAAEDELVKVKAQLHTTIEQYESQVEEAKAANEELQAMNEELRSAAEELETSKEELQSVNEELSTVNQELKIKIDELGVTSNDFQNLINSTEIGTIFLDRELRVKLSTPRAHDVFNLLPTDVGRPLTDITSRFTDANLHVDVALVLERLQTIEREIEAHDGRWYQMRLLPYRTLDDRIDGVVMTFHDISARHHAELQVQASEARLQLIVDSATEYAIITMNESGAIESWNSGAERTFGYTRDEVVGQAFSMLFTSEDQRAGTPERELEIARTEQQSAHERWHVRKDGSRVFCSGMTMRMGYGRSAGFAKITRDQTVRQRAETELQRTRDEFEVRVEERTRDLRTEVSEHADARAKIQSLLRRLVTAQEDERARIARDLHDQFGQQLTSLRLELERYRSQQHDGDGATAAELDRALTLTRSLDADVDFLAWQLRPAVLDDLGLKVALPRYVDEWGKHYGISAELRTSHFDSGQLSQDAELVFYRVCQEALTNVMKHASASRVDVILETRGDSVVLVIEDDGVGFDPADLTVERKGVGLAGMRERAALVDATLDVESSPGQGRTIFLRGPIHPHDVRRT